MRAIFLTGKGGVGKSTLSGALACQLADRGQRVLAVSLDPAHNLGDVFGVELGPRKKRHTDTLYLQEVDLNAAAERYTHENTALLKQTYSYLSAVNLDKYFDVLKYSPGVEEYAALLSLEEILRRETGFDTIVFDTPPTGLTLRIRGTSARSRVTVNGRSAGTVRAPKASTARTRSRTGARTITVTLGRNPDGGAAPWLGLTYRQVPGGPPVRFEMPRMRDQRLPFPGGSQ